jgi:hypothetical protein
LCGTNETHNSSPGQTWTRTMSWENTRPLVPKWNSLLGMVVVRPFQLSITSPLTIAIVKPRVIPLLSVLDVGVESA